MPVYKYRDVADMPRVPPTASGDLVARIRAAWRRAQIICPPSPPRGVKRFRSGEAASEARELATLERMRKTARRP